MIVDSGQSQIPGELVDGHCDDGAEDGATQKERGEARRERTRVLGTRAAG